MSSYDDDRDHRTAWGFGGTNAREIAAAAARVGARRVVCSGCGLVTTEDALPIGWRETMDGGARCVRCAEAD